MKAQPAKTRSILWFRQDLRVHDNEALVEALRNSDEVIPVYIFDLDTNRISEGRIRFLEECIENLRLNLRKLGSDLVVRAGNQAEVIYQLALETDSHWVYCNRERTRDEVRVQDELEKKLWTIGRELRYTRGKMLFYTSDLPFPVTHCPDAFPVFRKEVSETIPVRLPLPKPDSLPPIPVELDPGIIPSPTGGHSTPHRGSRRAWTGGEDEALKALEEVLNNISRSDAEFQGTRLSPWISSGCLSPKMVYHAVEKLGPAGEKIRHNLVYRDYLRLMGKKYGDLIFKLEGIRDIQQDFVNNEELFGRWKEGLTGVPIIDAAMRQLHHTGWMPDTLRRLTSSYFIKALQLDWRKGAAWFEYCLLDYDPCSNWVSWQNNAGIGPDPREDRIIHYDAVGKKIDPSGDYVRLWAPDYIDEH